MKFKFSNSIFVQSFSNMSIDYRERNEEDDELSKACLQLDPGSWHIQLPKFQEHKNNQISEYLHPSFY